MHGRLDRHLPAGAEQDPTIGQHQPATDISFLRRYTRHGRQLRSRAGCWLGSQPRWQEIDTNRRQLPRIASKAAAQSLICRLRINGLKTARRAASWPATARYPPRMGLVCGPPPQANRYQKGVTITRRSREPSAPLVEK
jgi:hypothetical protein